MGFRKDGIQWRDYFPKHGIGGNTAGKDNLHPGILLQCIFRCPIDGAGNAAQRISCGFCGNRILLVKLMNFVLNTGQRKLHSGTLHFEGFFHDCFLAEAVDVLSAGERQLQQLTGAVNELTGRNVGSTADFGAAHILPFRFHQQKFCGTAGKMPSKMGFVHQIQTACAPQRSSHMSLLMGNFDQRYSQRIGKKLCVGISHHKTGHITALNSPGAGADTNRSDRVLSKIGKQPAGKLRQAFNMGKYSVGLTQTQLSLFHRQQSGAIHTGIAIEISNGGGVIAGINADDAHSVASASFFSVRLRAKLPRMPLTKEPVSSPSYFFAIRTASEMATPVGTSSMYRIS